MKNLLKLSALSLSLSFGVVACGGDGDLGKLKDEACACKTKECGQAVNKKMDAAFEKISSEKELEKLAPVIAEAGTCLAKLGVTAE